MIGYAVGIKPDWIVIVSFALTIVMTIYLILDLDRPRRGIITMKDMNSEIVKLREMFENNGMNLLVFPNTLFYILQKQAHEINIIFRPFTCIRFFLCTGR